MKSFDKVTITNISISAAELVKSSLAQMVYLMYNEDKRFVTDRQLQGVEYQKSFKFEYEEMRGSYKPSLFYMNFSIDGIDKNTAYEVKMINPEAPVWLFKMSVLQSSFYYTLIKHVSYLKTATFHVKAGNEPQTIYLNNYPIDKFILIYGTKRYEISMCDELFDFYINKLKYLETCIMLNDISKSIEMARQWDIQFKKKEIDLFYHKIGVKELCEPKKKSLKSIIKSFFNWVTQMFY